MTTKDDNKRLPGWAYVLLAVVSACIGLASSVVTAKFFVIGLERFESDGAAREVLISTGMLMIATELVAFGLAALLPIGRLRALKTKLIVCGVLLLGFEAATIYITQVALIQSTSAGVTANTTRIGDLRQSIDNRRDAAKTLRANGQAQTTSNHAWVRNQGAATLRDALKVELDIEPMAAELARLEATARPDLHTILGENGMVTYSVIRALLISAMGIVMFGAAGVLLRESRTGSRPHEATKARTQSYALQYGTSLPTYKLPALRCTEASPVVAIASQAERPTTTTAVAMKPMGETQQPAVVPPRLQISSLINAPYTVALDSPEAPRVDGKRPQLRSLVTALGKGWCNQISKIPDRHGRKIVLQNG